MTTWSNRLTMTTILAVTIATAMVVSNVSADQLDAEKARDYVFNGSGRNLRIGAQQPGLLGRDDSPPPGQTPASAQAVSECVRIYTFTGDSASNFGWRVADAGDVNNDGFDDIIVGAMRDDSIGNDAGRANVYSGSDGSLLYTMTGEVSNDYFGFGVGAAGDLNRDGFDDVIVGAIGNDAGGNQAGRAYVFLSGPGPYPIAVSAADADMLFTGDTLDYMGASVSSVGDIDGDTIPELLVGSWPQTPLKPGVALLYSGQTFALLHTFTGEAAGDAFGYSSNPAGDVNNDGVTDIIIGAFDNDSGGQDAGRAYVYSGQDFSLMYTFTGEEADDGLGGMVSGAGDVDADGFDDLIVGAPFNDAGGLESGRAYVFLGGPGPFPISVDAANAYYVYTGAAQDLLGWSVSGAGDQDGDGSDDFVIGAPTWETGKGWAYIHSGNDGSLIQTFEGEVAADWYGRDVFAGADINGDGANDLMVGALAYAGGLSYGRAYVYLLGDVDSDSVLTACDNCPTDANADQADADSDGIGDVCDNCPADSSLDQTDTDADGAGDICDNCPIPNPGQENVDSDSLGDSCDNCIAVPNNDQAITIAMTGDVNESGSITSADIIFLVGFVFKGQEPPQPCEAAGDVNCTKSVTSADIIYLVGFVFKGADPPCDICQATGLGWTCP